MILVLSTISCSSILPVTLEKVDFLIGSGASLETAVLPLLILFSSLRELFFESCSDAQATSDAVNMHISDNTGNALRINTGKPSSKVKKAVNNFLNLQINTKKELKTPTSAHTLKVSNHSNPSTEGNQQSASSLNFTFQRSNGSSPATTMYVKDTIKEDVASASAVINTNDQKKRSTANTLLKLEGRENFNLNRLPSLQIKDNDMPDVDDTSESEEDSPRDYTPSQRAYFSEPILRSYKQEKNKSYDL